MEFARIRTNHEPRIANSSFIIAKLRESMGCPMNSIVTRFVLNQQDLIGFELHFFSTRPAHRWCLSNCSVWATSQTHQTRIYTLLWCHRWLHCAPHNDSQVICVQEQRVNWTFSFLPLEEWRLLLQEAEQQPWLNPNKNVMPIRLDEITLIDAFDLVVCAITVFSINFNAADSQINIILVYIFHGVGRGHIFPLVEVLAARRHFWRLNSSKQRERMRIAQNTFDYKQCFKGK